MSDYISDALLVLSLIAPPLSSASYCFTACRWAAATIAMQTRSPSLHRKAGVPPFPARIERPARPPLLVRLEPPERSLGGLHRKNAFQPPIGRPYSVFNQRLHIVQQRGIFRIA